MNFRVALLPGDGIGQEVVGEGVRVLRAVGERSGHTFETTEALVGGCAIDATGTPLPEDTLALCLASDAVLLGAVGGPKWNDPLAKVRPEQGLLHLRKEMGLFANVRPVKVYPELRDASPLRPEVVSGADLVIARWYLARIWSSFGNSPGGFTSAGRRNGARPPRDAKRWTP